MMRTWRRGIPGVCIACLVWGGMFLARGSATKHDTSQSANESMLRSANSADQKPAAPAEESAEALLAEVDRQLTFHTLQYHLELNITYSPGDSRTVKADVWAAGRDSAYLEFTAPQAERGTRYLKLEKSLWIHQPNLSRSVLIQGHMLRQGVLGGDFSYEDMLETGSLLDDYEVKYGPAEDSLQVLELTAKRPDVTYPRRVLWVDPVLKIPRRSQLMAASGKILKTVELGDVKVISGRNFPTRIVMRDLLKQKSFTVMNVIDPVFDQKVDRQIFTRRHLERESP